MINKNTALKQDDIRQIRKCFYQGKVMTKKDVRETTGISYGGITNILQELLVEKEILYVSDADSTGGRRSKQYVLNPDYAHIGTVNCHRHDNLYFFDTCGYAVNGEKCYSHCSVLKDGTFAQLKRETGRLMRADSLISVLVINIPGFCEEGVVRLCDFHNFEGIHIQEELGLNIPVVIENDVNTACIGLYHEEKHENMALIYQPSAEYSGAGLILHGRLYNGSNHRAGEMRYLYGEEPAGNLNKPVEQLRKEISAIQAVLDPEVIGWHSDLVEEKELLKYMEGSEAHLKQISDLNALIETGMYAIGKDDLMNHGKGENI